ncbi:MAG: alpha/beta hydrolase [Alphaproteobacteria bacterium]|nr:alpha/beta hydrolase [Alphaproteobacteria bacterium]
MNAPHSAGTKRSPAWLGAALCSLILAAPQARAAASQDCHVGTYRLEDGSIVDVAPSEGDSLRWRRFDGTTGALHKTRKGDWRSTYGWTDRPDGKTVAFSDCSAGTIRFGDASGRLIPFDVTDATFKSHGTALAGRLVLPKGNAKVPIVVLVHGAEHDSALVYYSLQRMLPASGVGAFVYDKRGTGKSAGTYTQDFNLLADDAVAATREARRLAGARVSRIGFQGGSEGGWVAPIAANRSSVDFVIVCFGLAVSVIDEDQQEVMLEMRDKGHTPGEIAQALEVARAAETVIASGFTRGFKQFDVVRAKYRNASWYKDLHGNYTYALLPYSEAQLRELGPKYIWGTPFYYDPMPTLRADTTPQLWILGGADYEAPSGETGRRITSLIAAGRPFTLAIYPHAEHGMTLFETVADDKRVSTRYAPGYFAMIRDFALNGRLQGAYGNAQLTVARHGAP